ncbi:trypsin-like peptidase domain-containing protein [Streptomyces pseudovenezuelae]|uniref:trypsin-like peptidase domain-containing protein n=1 Tax=Streptomyces pseudovenezuelae TaxID=67350 RepID=UPI0036E7BB9A
MFDRTVEVLYDRGQGRPDRWRAGSGFLVAGTHVLTAAHVVDHGGPGRALIRTLDGTAHDATVLLVTRSGQPDLALLDIVDSDFTAGPPVMRLAVVDRSRVDPVTGCWATGFPRFQSPRGRRQTAQAWGYILPGTNLGPAGHLELHTTTEPRALTGQESAWQGMSGAAVLAEAGGTGGEPRLIGVMIEHNRAAGAGAITLESIGAILGLADSSVWLAALGAHAADDLRISLAQVADDRPTKLVREVLAESARRAAHLLPYGPDTVDQPLARLALRLGAAPSAGEAVDRGTSAVLASPQLSTLVDQMLGRQLLHQYSASASGMLRAAFRQLCRVEGLNDDRLEQQLFDALESSVSRVAPDLAVSGTELDGYRERSLIYDIDTIREQLAALHNHVAHTPSEASIRSFRERLREVTRATNSHISLTLLGQHRSLPIEAIYVEPQLTIERETREQPEPFYPAASKLVVRLPEVISRHTVVLGGPGAGKSTLTVKLAYDGSAPDAVRRPIAFVVTLRHLVAERANQSLSLVEYLTSAARADLQMADASPEIMHYLLICGELHVIFDGLDEVIDPIDYDWVVTVIDGFRTEYKAAQVTVTSRIHGFDRARFADFDVYTLAPFDDQQVADYAGKWFALDESLTAAQRSVLLGDFLQQSAVAADLRETPLLLALMCSIFVLEGDIPSSRSEIYQRCANLYFRDWDTRRKIRSSPILSTLPAHMIFDAFSFIAAIILADQEKSGTGVTESELRQLVRRFLADRELRDPGERESITDAFTGFLVGRAWLFDKVGRNDHGVVLYHFTHRTFMEYFAAEYQLRNSTPQDMAEFVMDTGPNSRERVVAELAFQLSSRSRPAETARAVRDLIRRATHSPLDEQEHPANFLAGALSTCPFDRRTVGAIVWYCLRYVARATELGPSAWSENGYGYGEGDAFVYRCLAKEAGVDWVLTSSAVLGRLLSSRPESESAFLDAVRAVADAIIIQRPWAGAMLLCALTVPVFDGGEKFTVDVERWKQLKSMKRELWIRHRAVLQQEAWRDRSLATMALFAGNSTNVTLANLVAWHGPVVLNQVPMHPLGLDFPSIGQLLIKAAIWADGADGWPDELNRSALMQVYSLARAADRPLTKTLYQSSDTYDIFTCVVAEDQAVRNPEFTAEQETGAAILIMQQQFLGGASALRFDLPTKLGPHLEPLRPFLERWHQPQCGYAECLDLLVANLPHHCAIVLADHATALRQMKLDDLPEWTCLPPRRIDLDAAKAPVTSGPDAELPPEYAL